MPELPEVETLVRSLRQPLIGRTITGVTVTWPPMVQPSAEELAVRLPGQRIEQVERRGKYLVFALSGGDWLLIHQKMGGGLPVVPPDTPPGKHDRVVFDLDDGGQLRFVNPRKFGRVYLVDEPAAVVGALGPEPLEEGFDVPELGRRARSHRRRIKPLLLDQTVIAGLGNIYADEALFLAGIHPLRSSDTLSDEEIERLYHAIRSVLTRGIERRGASFDWVYPEGGFQEEFRVYGRTGLPCVNCGQPIHRLIVGGRGTHVCVNCQPEDPAQKGV